MKLVLIFLLVSVAGCFASWFPPTHDKNCGFTRDDALQCALKYGDINHDQRLTVNELDRALDVLVPGYIRHLPAFLTGIDAARVLRDCDYDKDGALTPHDWEMSQKTCMPKQENLCQFKWFCDYAKSKNP